MCGGLVRADITMTRLNLTFPDPVGIDYNPVNANLVLSVNWPSGLPNNFYTLTANGVFEQFSTASGWPGEIQISVAQVAGNGFSAGDMFSTGNTAGHIAYLPASGVGWALWELHDFDINYTEPGTVDGGVYASKPNDGWGGEAIVTTSVGNVWRVHSPGSAHLIATVPNVWLEGVVTVPNDSRYGPWARCIVAGTENTEACKLYSVSTAGVVTSWQVLDDVTGWAIQAEDLKIIPPNQNLYAVNYGRRGIYYANANQFTGMVGDILVAQEGAPMSGLPAKLYRVYYAGGNTFKGHCIYTASEGPGGTPPTWEQFCFAPIVVTPPAGTTVGIVAGSPSNTLEDQGEGSEACFIVSRTGDAEPTLTVHFSYPPNPPTALYGCDYYLLATDQFDNALGQVTDTLVFPNYASWVKLQVVPVDDRQNEGIEGTENVTVALVADPAYTVDPRHSQATCTIQDDAADNAGPKPVSYNVYLITPASGGYYSNWSEAYGICNDNTVTGFFNPPPNYSQWTPHACRAWYNAAKVDLNPGSSWWTWGYGIRDDRVVVGSARPPIGGGYAGDYACWWSADNVLTLYSQVKSGSYYNEAVAINDSFVVVGSGKNENGVYQAIRWDFAPPYSLGSLASGNNYYTTVSYAYGVNTDGHIIGKSKTSPSASTYHAFRMYGWRIEPATDDLGTGTGADTDASEALGINCVGETVGATHFNTASGKRYHAFHRSLYPGKSVAFIDLTPDKYWGGATAINNHGHIVGAYMQTSSSAQAGFIRYNDGTFADLWNLAAPPRAGLVDLGSPEAINDNGFIVGVGHVYNDGNYEARGFILVPAW